MRTFIDLLARRRTNVPLIVGLFYSGALVAQERAGELRIAVSDPSGAVLEAHCEVFSDANRFALQLETGPTGEYTVKKLPFGSYKVSVQHGGFAPFSTVIEIRSEIPVMLQVSLKWQARSRTSRSTIQELSWIQRTQGRATHWGASRCKTGNPLRLAAAP